MLAKVNSFGILGIEAYPVEIEVDIASGLPAVSLIGLPDLTIKESKERIKPAIKNSGFEWPAERITINLTPLEIRKEGACFDLPIALGVLAAMEELDAEALKEYVIVGQISLDGNIKPVKGVLPIVSAMSGLKKTKIILPVDNAKEASLIRGIRIYPVSDLRQAVQFISECESIGEFKSAFSELGNIPSVYNLDFSEVNGQLFAKRALEVAVCGMHNVLMIGPPGSGKTMLAKRIPTIMPDMSMEEALEATKIHSVTGTLPIKDGIVRARPFRAVHHTVSYAGLIGGGSMPTPGEISLSHNGVLFLDELPEFRRDCLQALRQPLEDGYVRVSRIKNSSLFPSSFMLAAAMNPCPCGFYTDSRKPCRCSTTRIESYISKISGPLLDRIDIHIDVSPLKYKELSDVKEGEASCDIKKRIEQARKIQRERLQSEGVFYNSQMNGRLIKKYCVLEQKAQELLRMAMTELGLSARGYDKILKVSRTIADLAGSETIQAEHISEAAQYRSLDR